MVGKDGIHGIDIILKRPDLISCSPTQVYSPCILTVPNFIPIRGYTKRDGVRTVPTKCTACLLWSKLGKRHEHKRKKIQTLQGSLPILNMSNKNCYVDRPCSVVSLPAFYLHSVDNLRDKVQTQRLSIICPVTIPFLA